MLGEHKNISQPRACNSYSGLAGWVEYLKVRLKRPNTPHLKASSGYLNKLILSPKAKKVTKGKTRDTGTAKTYAA